MERLLVIGKLGEKRLNKSGLTMEIIVYKKYNDINVKFEKSGHIVNTRYSHFINGDIKDPYMPTVYNKGFVGEGEYETRENGKITNRYLTWNSMMKRCYDEKQIETRITYKDCSVYKEWHNFQNFSKWYDENYYEVDGERMELDKDILLKGNKIYSPDTCVFVPQRINALFLKRNGDRGEFPIGVYLDKKSNKYKSQCAIGKGKIKNLGRYEDINNAFLAYKLFKEKLIKQIAEEYKDKIPCKLYKAMYSYQVEITD